MPEGKILDDRSRNEFGVFFANFGKELGILGIGELSKDESCKPFENSRLAELI